MSNGAGDAGFGAGVWAADCDKNVTTARTITVRMALEYKGVIPRRCQRRSELLCV